METTSLLSSSQIPLPPMPARGAHDAPPSDADFRTMLASQGVAAPKNGTVPSAMEAQIAAKATVNAGVKRGMVLPAASAAPVAIPPVATEGRFMSLRTGPGAAKIYSGPVIQNGAGTTQT